MPVTFGHTTPALAPQFGAFFQNFSDKAKTITGVPNMKNFEYVKGIGELSLIPNSDDVDVTILPDSFVKRFSSLPHNLRPEDCVMIQVANRTNTLQRQKNNLLPQTQTTLAFSVDALQSDKTWDRIKQEVVYKI